MVLLKRWLGVFFGFLLTIQFGHLSSALAAGLKATTMQGRIGSVMIGVLILFALMIVIRKRCSSSFYHGFAVSTGLFLSFDIVVFHWIFQLHRITNGPEANVMEPLFVVAGAVLMVYAWRKEKRSA